MQGFDTAVDGEPVGGVEWIGGVDDPLDVSTGGTHTGPGGGDTGTVEVSDTRSPEGSYV